MKSALRILPLLLVTACARLEWVKPGVDAGQVASDKAECDYEAVKAAASKSSRNEIDHAFAKNDVRNACLATRGYHRRRV